VPKVAALRLARRSTEVVGMALKETKEALLLM